MSTKPECIEYIDATELHAQLYQGIEKGTLCYATSSSSLSLLTMYIHVDVKNPAIDVIDVRDEDYSGGHLRFSRNFPSEEWENDSCKEKL